MKNIFRISGVILLILSIFLIHSCKKKEEVPVITTTAVTAIYYTTASSGGDLTKDGGSPILSRGICWNTLNNPTVANSKTSDGTGTGSFTSSLTQLTPNTKYYVKAYATNGAGTGYGNQVTFTTSQVAVPVLTTTEITSITQTTAVSGGNITADNGGSVTARGVCWGTTTNPTTTNNKTTDGTGTGSFSSNLTSLQPVTIYYVKSYATNSSGTAYGNEISFTTTATLPTLTTTASSAIALTTATSGGNVTSDGGATVTARGVCWSTSTNPTITDSKTTDGTGTGIFTSSIIGLAANTTYYLRAYATNSIGISYGTQVSFTTDPLTISDIDGNIYNVLRIGTQLWMKENLKTTKYSDGTPIPQVTDAAGWSNPIPSYCWYNDVPTYKNTYGALYNWYTVNTGKLCPSGWHVPTNAEWTRLTDYLSNNNYGYYGPQGNGNHYIAKSMAATSGWTTYSEAGTIGNDQPSNNSSGFTALPGGYRYQDGSFYGIWERGFWWSAAESSLTDAWSWGLNYNYSTVSRSNLNHKTFGFSVRCVRD